MTHSKEEEIQATIENLLRNNQFKSYSKEEIINLISADTSTQEKIEKILGEMEVWSSMKDTQSSVYSSCKGGTVYFQWGQTP
jgi:arginine repressor